MLTDIERFIRLLFLGLLAAIFQGEIAASTELKFIRPPGNVYVVSNRSFTWPCDINTSEQNGSVHFQWTKDGRNLTGSDRRVVLANGSLYFSQIVHRKGQRLSDEGQYRCLATNSLGSIISPRASLRVAVLPRIISPPGSSGISSPSLTEGAGPLAVSVTQAYLGDSVRLHCNITGSSPLPQVSWVRDGTTLPPSRMENKYFVLELGVLHIINLESSDAGDYQCLARNFAEQRQSPPLRLRVTESSTPRPPRILSPHQNVTSLARSDVTLQCLVEGSPPPRTYWTRQNGALLLDSPRYRQLRDGSLYIAHIQHSDQGIYICHASGRPAFENEATISAAVRVLVSPKFKMRPEPPNPPLFYGYLLKLHCRVMGQPVPKITWFKNGALLHIHGRVKTQEHGSKLEVGQCQPTDAGYYQCYAENEAGVVQSSTYVTIEKPPHPSDPPVNVTIVDFTNTTIKVGWLSPPASPNFPIIAFTVHYFPVEDGQEIQIVVDLSHQIEQGYTIQELIPFTNYTIYLVAYTPQGASKHSTYLYQQTAEGVPAAGPPVVLTPTSPSTMQVEWEALPPNLAGGRLKNYKLVYRSQGLASQYTPDLPPEKHQHLLTSLMPGTKYYVRVEAATSVGYNLKPTEKMWPWTFANTPTSIPVNSPAPPLTSLSANRTSVSVVWEEPGEDEPIVEYRLICVDLSELEEESKILGATARTHVFTSLKSGNWYEITVSARNRFGYGREVSQRIQTLVTARDGSGSQPTVGPPIPLPPIDIEISPVTSSQVRITWSDLPSTQPIVRYSILYYMVEPKPTVQVQEHYRDSSNDIQVARLADLAPFTEYELAIQSHTQSAKSSYSKKRRFMTLEGVPSSPEDLTGAARRPGSVELHWRPPERTNGIIMSYIIMYNVDAGQNEDRWLKRTHNGSSTSAVIDDLEADKSYFFKLIATTKAGSGPPTPPLRVSALCAGPDCKAGPTLVHGVDRSVGVGIGVGIALGAVVLVVLIIFVKHRCSRYDPPPPITDPNAIYRPTGVSNGTLLGSRGVEIESYIPMLPVLAENSASDSKGGVVHVRVKMQDCLPSRQDSQRIHLLTSSNSTSDDPSKTFSGRPVSLTIDNDHVANLVTNGNVPSSSSPSSAVAMETVLRNSGSTQPTNHDRSAGPRRADETIQVNRGESVRSTANGECRTASDDDGRSPSKDVSFSTSDLNGNPNNDALPSNDLDSRTDNQAQFLPPDDYLSVA